MSTIKVHMIGNAHLDPVWLWSYGAGVDEALATAYAAANMLDEYAEFVFTRSDTWFHQIIENLNPELFERVRGHVASGRWRVVGGWYVQPDCNLPTGFSFRKHITMSQAYNRDRFGVDVTVGYNVDSFGHAGTLPRLLAEGGYTNYVFMRPGPHEKELPNPVFRWRAADSDHEVVTCRLNHAYCHHGVDRLREHVMTAVEAGDASLGHVMCFYGVGDHGGGPTRRQIEWIIENRTALEGLELLFSHPEAYFRAIADRVDALPVVTGELQYHAVGCYTSLRSFKAAMRQAEHGLARAEAVARQLPDTASPDASGRLARAWEDVLLNQFHDTYGGTCLRSAYPETFAQLGRAQAVGDDIIRECTRRCSAGQPDVVLTDRARAFAAVLNPGPKAFSGMVEHEFHGLRSTPVRLVDDATGAAIPCEYGDPESRHGNFARLLFPLELAPGQTRVLRAEKDDSPATPANQLTTEEGTIGNGFWTVRPEPCGMCLTDGVTGQDLALSLQVLHDLSDTWSHGIQRFDGDVLGRFRCVHMSTPTAGAVRASIAWIAEFAASRVRVQIRLHAHDPWAELAIDLFWAQHKAVLKLVAEPMETIVSRIDGIPGGSQRRTLDGHEYPLHDWTLSGLSNGRDLGFVIPDAYALDGDDRCVRFTMVRSPQYALHSNDVPDARHPDRFLNDFLDQGEHTYRMLIRSGASLATGELSRLARQLQQPPVVWDPPYRRNFPG